MRAAASSLVTAVRSNADQGVVAFPAIEKVRHQGGADRAARQRAPGRAAAGRTRLQRRTGLPCCRSSASPARGRSARRPRCHGWWRRDSRLAANCSRAAARIVARVASERARCGGPGGHACSAVIQRPLTSARLGRPECPRAADQHLLTSRRCHDTSPRRSASQNDALADRRVDRRRWPHWPDAVAAAPAARGVRACVIDRLAQADNTLARRGCARAHARGVGAAGRVAEH
mgnify:CR=1 FL=1